MHLTKKAVIESALKALDDGCLQLQTDPKGECSYEVLRDSRAFGTSKSRRAFRN